MKFLNLIALIVVSTSLGSVARAGSSLKPDVETLKRALRDDVVVGSAIEKARSLGETCEIDVRSIGEDRPEEVGGVDFEAQVDCGVPSDGIIGGGIVLMINVKGKAFGEVIDQLKIEVAHAG